MCVECVCAGHALCVYVVAVGWVRALMRPRTPALINGAGVRWVFIGSRGDLGIFVLESRSMAVTAFLFLVSLFTALVAPLEASPRHGFFTWEPTVPRAVRGYVSTLSDKFAGARQSALHALMPRWASALELPVWASPTASAAAGGSNMAIPTLTVTTMPTDFRRPSAHAPWGPTRTVSLSTCPCEGCSLQQVVCPFP